MLDQMQQDYEDVRKWNVLRQLCSDRRLEEGDLRVAYFLLVPRDEVGHARESLVRLAELTHLDVENVKRSILHLERLGYFTVIPPTAQREAAVKRSHMVH
jgi:hypothetical protein